MSSPEKGRETQLRNIQARTGKTLDELSAMVRQSGLTRHGEVRAMLQRELGLGYGDANALAQYALQSEEDRAAKQSGATPSDVLSEIYTGAKAALRPIQDRLMVAIAEFGPFEIAPKKGYVSLRRRRQFAMIGPATNTRVEVGLNIKGLEPHARLLEQPEGSMCNYQVRLTEVGEVDDELIAWVRKAYDAAG
jgi:hypothetical protein